MFCLSCTKGCYQNALTTRLQYGVHCYIESSTFQLAAASVSTRSVGSVDHGFFGGLGGSHCEDRKSVAFFFLSIRALLNAHSVHSLKGSVTGCVNGLPNERRILGFGRKSIF